jgi:putative DNA methylase
LTFVPEQVSVDTPGVFENQNVGLSIDAHFPEHFTDALSRCEVLNKHLFRPNTYLHKWWARRCGSTFRAILKQLVSDPSIRDYYAPGGLEGKIILDPMIGGGTTLHEAIRLGASVIGADLDAIPIVQARASLTEIPLEKLQYAFHHFFDRLYQQIGHYFQTECPSCQRTLDAQYTLYGLRKRCQCGEVVQIDQYELRQEAERTLRICPSNWEIIDTSIQSTSRSHYPRLIPRKEIRCACCGQLYTDLLETPYYARYVPIAVVGTCTEHGYFVRSPSDMDRRRIHEANELRPSMDFGSQDHFVIQDGPKSGDLIGRGIHSYLDVFSSRQLIYLHQAMRLLPDNDRAIRLNLALLISTSLEFNAMLCGYKGWFKRRPGAVRHVFSLHAYSFPYTALENNPVNCQKSSGNLQRLFHDRLVRGRTWALSPVERSVGTKRHARIVPVPGERDLGTEVFDQTVLMDYSQAFWLIHGDSRCLPVADQSVDFIVTDPPYYDSVHYSDLAAFFRVWLERLLPDEADWRYDEKQSAVAIRTKEPDSHFMTILSDIFQECGRVLKDGTGRLIFTFHHWDPNAWADLTIALQQARFKLINRYVVFSEHPISIHINNLKSIKHDTILVLALEPLGHEPSWTSLAHIDTSESENFCRQCGSALGWLLQQSYAADDIRAFWSQMIERKS